MKKQFSLSFLLFFVFILTLSGQANLYQLYEYNSSNGMSGNNVRVINQDKSGLIWIGTNFGLSTFNGYSFKNYIHYPNDSTSISNNGINAIYADDNIWIGTSDGLNLFDKENDCFIQYKQNNKPGSLSNNYVSSIIKDEFGNLWIGSFNGIDKYNPTTNSFTNYKAYSSKGRKNWALKLLSDKKGNLWIGTFNGGLLKFNIEKEEFTKYMHDENDSYSISGNKVRDIIEDKNGNILIATSNGFNLFDRKKEVFINKNNTATFFDKLPSYNLLKINLSENGTLWIGSMDNGLILLDKDKNIISKFFQDNETKLEKIGFAIMEIYKDKNDNFWIGSESGLKHLIKNQTFFSIRIDSDNKISKETRVRSIYQDIKGGGIWIGSQNGLSYFDIRNKTLKHFKTPKYINKKRLSINHIQQTNLNELWLATNIGLFKYNIAQERMYNISYIPQVFISDMTKSNNNDFWLTTVEDGIFHYIYKQDCFEKKILIDELSSKEVISIHCEGDSILWIACRKELYKYNVILKRNKQYSFNNIGISYISQQKDGTLLLCSGNGFAVFNPEEKKVKNYSVFDGLPSNIIHTALEDNLNQIWISTDNGISLFKPELNKFYNFGISDGLSSQSFIRQSALKLDNGNLAFGGKDGITMIYPENVCTDINLDTILINTITILPNNKEDKQVIFNPENLVLNHRQSSLIINFSTIIFHSQDKVEYAYKLLGNDENWINIGDERKITFLNLSHGEYKFNVKAFDKNNPENFVETSVNFIINPPFWKTWWFKLLIIFIVCLSVLIAWLIRVQSLIMRQKELEEQVQERTCEISKQKEELSIQAANLQETNSLLIEKREDLEAASDELRTQADDLHFKNEELEKLNATKDKFFSIIAHDLRNPFHSIIGISNLLFKNFDSIPNKKKKEFLELLKNTSSKTYNLLENLLEWSRSQTNRIKVKKENLNLRKLLEDVYQIFNLAVEKKGITFKLVMEKDIIINTDNNILITVIRNLINNAIKFSYPNSEIEIIAKQNNKTIKISVKDQGVGMKKETIDKLFRIEKNISLQGTSGETGTGLGLILCKEFIDKLEGEINVTSVLDKGTTFTITFHNNEADKNSVQDHEIADIEKDQEINNLEEIDLEEHFAVGQNKFNVLIIDDNYDQRENLSSILKDYTVRDAENGEQGFSVAINYLPDLIICDIMMPVMDGIEFCAKIKNDERTNHIPIILLTANKEDEIKLSGIDSGADDYILKPFDAELLLKRIQNLIKLRNDLKKKFQNQIDITPKEITRNNVEEKFLQNAINVVESNLDDPEFNIDTLAESIFISRSLMYVKIKAITGQTANDFIKTIKLKKAAKYLTETEYPITEISAIVGYKNKSHFSVSFSNYFGLSPLKYRKKMTS